MTDYNALSADERRNIVELIRLDLGPEPVELDFSTPENFVETFVARYYFRTDLFAREQFGIELDEWQRQVALDVDAGERLISVRACHNVGKSLVFAVIAAKFLLTRWRCKIVMTAPTAGQLFDALYAEVRSLLARLRPEIYSAFNVKSDRIEMVSTPQDAFLSVRTASKDRPDAIQGVHSDFVLLVVDEAPGVPQEVFNASGGSLAGHNCTLLMAGNPTKLEGRFAESHLNEELRKDYRRYHVSKHPDESVPDGTKHYTSNRITDDFEKQIIAEHGKDSDEYQIRVLGNFPSKDANSYIPADIVKSAMQRPIEPHWQEKRYWAIDPARYGKDGTAFGKSHGKKITGIERKRQLDTMQVAGWVKHEWDECPASDRPMEIFIDVIGIGAGVYDRLHEQGLPVRAVNVSESPTTGGKFMRLRDELWAKMKRALQACTLTLPNDAELLSELTSPMYSYSSDGRLKIESKEVMRLRGAPSPDKADAACMLLMSDDFAVVGEAAHTRSWGAPIYRNLQAVP